MARQPLFTTGLLGIKANLQIRWSMRLSAPTPPGNPQHILQLMPQSMSVLGQKAFATRPIHFQPFQKPL
jgi:hypothetical protein